MDQKVDEETGREDIKLLDSLIEMEKRVDQTIISKRLELQEWLKTPSRVKCRIMIAVSPTFHVPSGFVRPNFTLPVTKAMVGGLVNPATLELKIDGKILNSYLMPDPINSSHSNTSSLPSIDCSKFNKKFGSFFKSVFVELDHSCYSSELRMLEWNRGCRTSDIDGFVVKRPVVTTGNFTASVVFTLGFNPPQYRPSLPLSKLLGQETQTQAHVIRILWKYISSNNLLDSYQGDLVHSNEVLRQIFNRDQFNLSELPDMTSSHLHPPEPISFSFTIKNPLADMAHIGPGSYSGTSETFEFETEIDNCSRDTGPSFSLQFSGNIFSMDVNELQALDSKFKKCSEQIVSSKAKIKECLSYAESPSTYINKWLRKQCSDFHQSSSSLSNDAKSGYSIEEDRAADFYCRPWSQEFVHKYLFNLIDSKARELNDVSRS